MANYEEAGVSFNRSDQLLDVLSKTLIDKSNLGAFASKIALPNNLKEPILLATTDGVGTKAQLASTEKDYYNIGVDLFAANANDILTHGVKPLSFLDYIATNKFEIKNIQQILSAIQTECSKLDCLFVGGESAELPNSFVHNGVELAGFCTGLGEKEDLVDPKNIKEGDAVIGLASSGFHANGYSLLRKILFDKLNLNLNDKWPSDDKDLSQKTLREVLLTPTKVYTKSVLNLKKTVKINGLANVTGGGIINNLNRILAKNVYADLKINPSQVFKDIAHLGEVSNEEMAKVFNLGVGYLVVVDPALQDKAIYALEAFGESAYRLGYITKQKTRFTW